MAGEQQEIFMLALKYFYEKYKTRGGTQKKLASRLGVTQSYISAVLTNTKKASIELQERLANILYGPYEEFLLVGRRIQSGLEPELIIKSDRDDEIESLISKLSHYIRDYQRIEKQLIDTKNFYKIIIEKMQSGVFVTDQNDKVYFMNTWLTDKIGIPANSVLGTYIPEANEKFPMLQLDELINYYLLAKDTFEPQEFTQIKIILPSKKEVYRSGWCIPVYDSQVYVGMIVTIGDITEEVLLKKNLRAQIQLMQVAMDSMDEIGLIILDSSKNIIFRNDMYRKTFNLSEEIMLEKSYRKNIEWIKQFVCDQKKFKKLSLELSTQYKKNIHEFDLLNGRRIKRIVCPFFDESDQLLGWNISLTFIAGGKTVTYKRKWRRERDSNPR